MRKMLVTGMAAIFAATAFAATPAAAGNFNFTLGLGGWGPGWGYGGGYYGGWGGPVYVNNWSAHVNWCFNHKGPTYNPNTNKYFKNGNWKYCNSPFY